MFAALIGIAVCAACDRPIEVKLEAYLNELHEIAAQPPSFVAPDETWFPKAQQHFAELQLEIRLAASIARDLDELMDTRPDGCIKTSFDISVLQKEITPARNAVKIALNDLLSATDQRTQTLEADTTVSDGAGEREAKILQLGVLARDIGAAAIQGEVAFDRLAERAEALSRTAARCD